MAIAPPSDLVLDVVRAADPQDMKLAAAKLQRLAKTAGATAADGTGFKTAIDYTRASTTRETSAQTPVFGAQSPAQKFEAMVLTQFVETMLPDDASSVFGEGNTGEIWKSMMAEQIANQLAASGGIGIAGLLSDDLNKGGEV